MLVRERQIPAEYACARVYVRLCVRMCVRACVCVCVRVEGLRHAS